MTDQEWQTAMLAEERKQTKTLNDMGCMILCIAFVIVGGAALSFFIAFMSFGATYSTLGR